MKIAIPRFGKEVAPCFEHTATMAVFEAIDGQIAVREEVPLSSKVAFDRVRLMRALDVDVVICGGVDSWYQLALEGNGIRVISWVSGKVEELVESFLRGNLHCDGEDDSAPSRKGVKT